MYESSSDSEGKPSTSTHHKRRHYYEPSHEELLAFAEPEPDRSASSSDDSMIGDDVFGWKWKKSKTKGWEKKEREEG